MAVFDRVKCNKAKEFGYERNTAYGVTQKAEHPRPRPYRRRSKGPAGGRAQEGGADRGSASAGGTLGGRVVGLWLGSHPPLTYFLELRKDEVRRFPLLGTPVNSAPQ